MSDEPITPEEDDEGDKAAAAAAAGGLGQTVQEDGSVITTDAEGNDVGIPPVEPFGESVVEDAEEDDPNA